MLKIRNLNNKFRSEGKSDQEGSVDMKTNKLKKIWQTNWTKLQIQHK